MKGIVISGLLGIVAFVGGFFSTDSNVIQPTAEQTAHTVIVYSADGGMGSGSILPGGMVLTAAHVVRTMIDGGFFGPEWGDAAEEAVYIQTEDGSYFSGRVLRIDYRRDLALIRVIGEPFAEMQGVHIDTTTALNDNLRMSGNGGYEFFDGHDGKYERQFPIKTDSWNMVDMLFVRVPGITGGDSGGPVFAGDTLNQVGVLVGGAPGHQILVPTKYVLDFLEQPNCTEARYTDLGVYTAFNAGQLVFAAIELPRASATDEELSMVRRMAADAGLDLEVTPLVIALEGLNVPMMERIAVMLRKTTRAQ